MKKAADAVFLKYDKDNSGTLEGKEIYTFINDSFKSLGRNREATQSEVDQFVKAFDKNKDNKISKEELLDVLAKLLNAWFPWTHKISEIKQQKILYFFRNQNQLILGFSSLSK